VSTTAHDDRSADADPGGAAPDRERSQVGPYLNRLSDLVWTMARWQEQGDSLLSRRASPLPAEPPEENR
jgi:anti-sigma factor RsiW